MRFIISLFFAFTLMSSILAQEISIIPQPVQLTRNEGNFFITRNTALVVPDAGDGKAADFLNWYLQQFYGFTLPVKKQQVANSISINTKKFIQPPDKDGYTLESGNTGVVISGDTYAGTFYGIQTLIQLLPPQRSSQLRIPAVSIHDEPRFGHRGSLLDAGRHFFPVSFIKKYIDYLALHKMNYFHWHLTEDAGWRIEIKKYPKLTETGAWRNRSLIGRYPGIAFENKRYGGYYTQEQIKDIVTYAEDRHVTIIPEIEMPGHSYAALASYPELGCRGSGYTVPEVYRVDPEVFCAGNEYTFEFLQNVLDEVPTLFPSKYIHIGGDECPKEGWKKCSRCQKRIKDNNLKDEHELQSYFIQRIEKYLNIKGRTLIAWDEILEGGLAPNAVVMSWRGEKGGIAAAKEKHYVIMTPSSDVYFDYPQVEDEDSVTFGGYGITPIEEVYNYEPIPKELSGQESKYVLGTQGNVWTEYMTNPRKVEYMLFPRIGALTEVLWSSKEKKNWDDFQNRLMTQYKRYDLWKVNYHKEYFELKPKVMPAEDYKGVVVKLETKNKNGTIRYSQGGRAAIPYKEPITINKTQKLSAALIAENKTIFQLTQLFHINKATGKKTTLVNEASDNYPGQGAFTLVNGIQNTKGLPKQSEFLGFLGTDCEAIIDFDSAVSINNARVHVYHQKGTWIYQPRYVEIFVSDDGKSFTSIAKTENASVPTGNAILQKNFAPVATRYVKVLVKNWGNIKNENPYGGNKAWLLVDEIEIN